MMDDQHTAYRAAALAALCGLKIRFWCRAVELARARVHRNATRGTYQKFDRNGRPRPVSQRAVLAVRHIERMGPLTFGGRFPLGLLRLVDADLTPKAVGEAFRSQERGFMDISRLRQLKDKEGRDVCSKDKRRFDIVRSEGGHWSVRVFQGHSNDVPVPPELLVRYDGDKAYHGTNRVAWESIRKTGLKPMGRDVHMGQSRKTAAGYRPNSEVTVVIDVKRLHAETDIVVFKNRGNGVLLCERAIPWRFLSAA